MQSIHLIDTPTGKYTFVGLVPHDLGYVMPDNTAPTAEYATNQMMLPANYRTIEERSFYTAAQALNTLAALGYSFCDSPACACRKFDHAQDVPFEEAFPSVEVEEA